MTYYVVRWETGGPAHTTVVRYILQRQKTELKPDGAFMVVVTREGWRFLFDSPYFTETEHIRLLEHVLEKAKEQYEHFRAYDQDHIRDSFCPALSELELEKRLGLSPASAVFGEHRELLFRYELGEG